MPKVKLDQLQEGMVVVSDVKNMDDMLLLRGGCTLTERHIKILHAWGITEVEVEMEIGQAEAPAIPIDPERMAQLTEQLKRRFWQFHENNPVEQEVFKLVLQRKLQGHAR